MRRAHKWVHVLMSVSVVYCRAHSHYPRPHPEFPVPPPLCGLSSQMLLW